MDLSTDLSSFRPLASAITIDDGMPTLPVGELQLALQHPDKFGLSASHFRHPIEREKAGRLMVTFGTTRAGPSPALASECPLLHSLVKAYQAHCQSHVMMLTWKDGLPLHVDKRAIEPSCTSTGDGFKARLAAKAAGSPRESIITLHTVFGGSTLLQYTAVGHLDTAPKAIQAPKIDPSKHDCVPLPRPPGQMQSVPGWMQSGFAMGARDASGALLVKRRDSPDVIGATVFHCAGAIGSSATVSVFGTCATERDRVRLRDALRLLEVGRRAAEARRAAESNQPEASGSEWLLWGGPFHASIPERFPLKKQPVAKGDPGHGAKVKAGQQKALAAGGRRPGAQEGGMLEGEAVLREATPSEKEVIDMYIEVREGTEPRKETATVPEACRPRVGGKSRVYSVVDVKRAMGIIGVAPSASSEAEADPPQPAPSQQQPAEDSVVPSAASALSQQQPPDVVPVWAERWSAAVRRWYMSDDMPYGKPMPKEHQQPAPERKRKGAPPVFGDSNGGALKQARLL